MNGEAKNPSVLESEGCGYDGAWVTRSSHSTSEIDGVYLIEVDALRAVNSRGYGMATFHPWGES